MDLIKTDKTVFTFNEIALLWGETGRDFIKKKIYRYKKAGKIFSIRRGIYSKDKIYDKYELATKVYAPSYISFETVLGAAGVTFQFYGQIFVASHQTKEIECDGQKYSFKKIKDEILVNSMGIKVEKNYNIASPERAFLDVIYMYKDYHFDNLKPLDWNKVYEIMSVYGDNEQMKKRVQGYYESFKKK